MREQPSGIVVDVWVAPRASRDSVGGLHGDRIKVAVSAPPVDGAANEAVRVALAKALGVAKSQVEVVSGLKGRQKTLAVSGDPGLLSAKAKALVGS
ncbi:MAG: YggU family protein [Myxococcales bacterium]|nr:YggU family protein [Myxococcales bacterium]